MFRLEHDILVEESPKVVWAFLAHLPVSLTCHRRRRSFQWVGNPSPGEGCRYTLEQRFAGIGWRQEGRVSRWEPPHILVVVQWHQRFPWRGFTHQLRLSVHEVEGQPRSAVLKAIIVGSLRPWLVERIVKGIVRRSLLDQLEALKCAIEATDKSGRLRREQAGRLAEMPMMGTG